MSDALEPDCRVLNTDATDRATSVIRSLKIGRDPVFRGRSKVLDVADALLPRPDEVRSKGAARGLFVIYSKGSLDKLGSRRLLREIACRFIRAGHVPLLLGPFSSVGPTTFSQLVGELLRAIGLARTIINLVPHWPELLGPAPANVTYKSIDDAIEGFTLTPDPNPWDVRRRLALEFESLVKGYIAFGAPFGRHTHVAVLGDAAHEWGAGLESLLDMVTDAGLGIPGDGGESRLVPLLITALFDVGKGIHLAEREGELTNVGNFRQLEMFEETEAIAAYKLDSSAAPEGWWRIHREGRPIRAVGCNPAQEVRERPLSRLSREDALPDGGKLHARRRGSTAQDRRRRRCRHPGDERRRPMTIPRRESDDEIIARLKTEASTRQPMLPLEPATMTELALLPEFTTELLAETGIAQKISGDASTVLADGAFFDSRPTLPAEDGSLQPIYWVRRYARATIGAQVRLQLDLSGLRSLLAQLRGRIMKAQYNATSGSACGSRSSTSCFVTPQAMRSLTRSPGQPQIARPARRGHGVPGRRPGGLAALGRRPHQDARRREGPAGRSGPGPCHLPESVHHRELDR
jgi:hypothetical protein